MSQTRPPDDPHRSRSLTLEGLERLLDAYGGAPERWPDTEREAAQRLIEQSDAARARWEEAAGLDRLLDTVPVEPPSLALAARVLAAAPRRRPARVWRRALAAAVPLAAAAAVTVWVAIKHEPARQMPSAPVVAMGEYTRPTDVLLGLYGIDVYGTVPSIGCSDSDLGCPNAKPAATPYSQRRLLGRLHA
jgi:hypothetical protein